MLSKGIINYRRLAKLFMNYRCLAIIVTEFIAVKKNIWQVQELNIASLKKYYEPSRKLTRIFATCR